MEWIFSETKLIEEHDFHKSLERFYKYGINGFIRENIQNSLDARLKDDVPVIIDISIGKVKLEEIPSIFELIPRIERLKGQNKYSKKTIEHMINKLKGPTSTLDYISIEDSNTKGLSGAKVAYNPQEANSYTAYAYARGYHFDANISREVVRGGSHGIGKIASNAASDLYLMFFANCDEEGYQTLGGNIQLIDHYYNEQAYRATGYFTRVLEEKFLAFENKGYADVFEKRTRGLKIIVPFLRDDYKNDGAIIRAIIDGFLLAFLRGDLIVNFKDKIIDQNTLESYLRNGGYYDQDFDTMMRVNQVFTPAYYDTINDFLYDEQFVVSSRKEDYSFKLFFRYDDSIPRGRTAIFRNIGMKIDDFKVFSKITASYNAVLIPQSKEGDEYLKSLENESHTELDYTHLKDQDDRENAKYFINQLHRKLQEVIDKEIERLTPTSDKLDTSDVLYEIKNKFERDLKKGITTVYVSKGKQKRIVKVTTTDEPGENGERRKGKKRDIQLHPVKRKFGGDESKTYYTLPTGKIRRTQSNTKEVLIIDVSGSEHLRGIKNASLNISIVDGMGKEHFTEYDLRDVYEDIYATRTGERILFESNRIINAPVINNTVHLECKLKKRRNNMKMKFYLEV